MDIVRLLAVFVLVPGRFFLAQDGFTQSSCVDGAKFAQRYVYIHLSSPCPDYELYRTRSDLSFHCRKIKSPRAFDRYILERYARVNGTEFQAITIFGSRYRPPFDMGLRKISCRPDTITIGFGCCVYLERIRKLKFVVGERPADHQAFIIVVVAQLSS